MATEPETVDSAESEEATERRPYIVVLMSAEMKDALKKYADEHDTNPTALARRLLAEHIGYALENEPQTTRRNKYTTDEERHEAHKLASKKSGLLRKALFLMHTGQVQKREELVLAANKAVLDLSDKSLKLDMEDLEAMDTVLERAKKGGK